jgi:hypothetical protein
MTIKMMDELDLGAQKQLDLVLEMLDAMKDQVCNDNDSEEQNSK